MFLAVQKQMFAGKIYRRLFLKRDLQVKVDTRLRLDPLDSLIRGGERIHVGFPRSIHMPVYDACQIQFRLEAVRVEASSSQILLSKV